MTAKELKKLSRKDLLEILLAQSKQMQLLQQQLEEAQAQIQSRKLEVEQAGSIAEAAMKVNGVFEAAEAAGQQYLENIKERDKRHEILCKQMEDACMQKVQQRIQEAEQERRQMLEEAKIQCRRILEMARAEAKKY